MLGVEEDNTICITHYINPHCFWYKSETAYIPHHEQRQFLEDFNEYCKRAFGYRREQSERVWYNEVERPKVGDLVAHHNKEHHRWIRCQVEDILVDLSGVVWYQLWAMDEGLPIKSIEEDFRPLPEAYTSHPGHAKRGALKNILPSEARYDYVQGKNVLKNRASWCPGIVTTLHTVLDDALSVRMVEHSNFLIQNEVIYFGELFIKTHHDKSFNIVDLLRHACSDQFIVRPDEEFFKAVFSIKTLNMVRYKNNDGIDNTSSRKIRFLKEPTVPIRDHPMRNTRNVGDGSSVQDKIGDWFSRNMKAIVEDQKITDEGKKVSPLINATPELAGGNKLPFAKHGATGKEEEKIESSEPPNDLHPSSTVQREVRVGEEGEEDKSSVAKDVGGEIDAVQPPGVSHAPEVSTIYEAKTSSIIRKILQLQAHRQQLGNKRPVATTRPVIGPAGCSIKQLLDNTNKRLNETETQ